MCCLAMRGKGSSVYDFSSGLELGRLSMFGMMNLYEQRSLLFVLCRPLLLGVEGFYMFVEG